MIRGSNRQMQILVDADACPVIPEIISVAQERDIDVLLVANFCHEYAPTGGVKVITVDKTPDAADIALMNNSRPGDIVVTQDYGVACMVLGKNARAISPRGKIFTDQNITGLMEQRHISRKQRQRGNRTRGPKPFSVKDHTRFSKNLKKLLELTLSNE